MGKSLFIIPLLCLGCFGVAASQQITLSADKKHLVNAASGQPVFITGDAAWSLIVQLNDADRQTYLRDRSARGFNAILVNLIEHLYSDTACGVGRGDRAGNCPFKGAAFSTPNETYFAHADYVIQQAQALGITVFLYPTYSGYECNAEGWCAEIQAASESVMANWGNYVGNRYKGFPNVVWVVGGDIDPASYGIKSKLNALAAAIREADPNHLLTAHGRPAESALDIWSGYPWLSMNTEYIESTITAENAVAQFRRSDFLPFYLTEAYYEGEYSTTPKQLRSEAYSAVLNGAYLGAFFGNNPTWCFGQTHSGPITCRTTTTWQGQLNSAGSVGHSWFGKLFRSREHWKLLPDLDHTVVTAGYGSGSTLSSTSRTSDGKTIITYMPNGNATTLTVDMTKVTDAQGAQVWWFNPATGDVTNGGRFSNRGFGHFTAPDSNDWVLVIDAASARLPLPGR